MDTIPIIIIPNMDTSFMDEIINCGSLSDDLEPRDIEVEKDLEESILNFKEANVSFKML